MSTTSQRQTPRLGRQVTARLYLRDSIVQIIVIPDGPLQNAMLVGSAVHTGK